MPTDRRVLLPASLVVGVALLLLVLSLVKETVPPAPEAAPPPTPVEPVSVPPPPARPPLVLPAEADVRDLADRLAARREDVAASAAPTLLWFFDRLAEAVGQAGGRFTKDSREPTPATAVAVVEALAEGGAEARHALIAALTTRVSRPDAPDAAAAAAAALGRSGPAAVEDLASYFEHAHDPALRIGLVRAAAALRPASDDQRTLLVAATKDVQPAVREAALEGLGALVTRQLPFSMP